MHLLFPSVIFNLTEGKLIYLLAHNHYTYTNNRNSNIFFPSDICLAVWLVWVTLLHPFVYQMECSLHWWVCHGGFQWQERRKSYVWKLLMMCVGCWNRWLHGWVLYHTAECCSGFWGYRLRTSCCWHCLYSAKWWGQAIENKFNLLIAIIILLTFAAIVNDWRV